MPVSSRRYGRRLDCGAPPRARKVTCDSISSALTRPRLYPLPADSSRIVSPASYLSNRIFAADRRWLPCRRVPGRRVGNELATRTWSHGGQAPTRWHDDLYGRACRRSGPHWPTAVERRLRVRSSCKRLRGGRIENPRVLASEAASRNANPQFNAAAWEARRPVMFASQPPTSATAGEKPVPRPFDGGPKRHR